MLFFAFFVIMALAFLASFKIFADAMQQQQSPEGVNTKFIEEYRSIQRIKDYDAQMSQLGEWRQKVMNAEQKSPANVIELSKFASNGSRKIS